MTGIRLDTPQTIYGARVHFHDDGSMALSVWREGKTLRSRVTYLVGPLALYHTSPDHPALDQALYALDRAFRGPYARILAARAAGVPADETRA